MKHLCNFYFKMTNVLINGLALNSQFTGVQYYIENLVASLHSIHLDTISVTFLVASGYQGNAQSNSMINLLKVKVNSTQRLKRIYFENFQLKNFLGKTFDLYHSPNYVLPFVPPLPSVVTVHDLIAIDYPRYSKNETVLYHSLFQRRSLQKAKKIIAVSHTVKKDIIRNFGIDADKISVILHGVHRHFKKIESPEQLLSVQDKYKLPSEFILFVGNIEPKKNLLRLLEAYRLFSRESRHKHKLVLVGKAGWKCSNVFKALHDLDLHNDVLLLGYVDEADLPAIYNLADLFVFPSLYEGFGIPPLEAMACETPVLVSNAGALTEITGNNCEYMDPFDVNQIAEKLNTLLSDSHLKSRLVMKGRDWVKNFTWERAAFETLNIYAQALN